MTIRVMKKLAADAAALMVCVFISAPGRANDIVVTNVVGTDRVKGSHWMVQFDVSWTNSWRSDLAGAGQSEPYNYDAAWVFIKYRTGGTSDWRHATLSTNAADHSAPTNATLKVGLDGRAGAWGTNGIGVFIYRNTNGSGFFAANNARLRWNYAADGVADRAQIELKVCAIEMVYVLEGAFYAGNTNYADNSNNGFRSGTDSNSPFYFPDDTERTIYWGTNNSSAGQSSVLSNAFPKGFSAFYGMKHDITQAQMVDHLNMLTRDQQTKSSYYSGVPETVGDFMYTGEPGVSFTNYPRFRNGVQVSSDPGSPNPRVYANNLNTNNAPNSSDDGQWIACNYIQFGDQMAYLDWAGLRPMSELEYEKACRGTKAVVAGELAWGSVANTPGTNILNSGTINESLLPTNANFCYNNSASVQGPVRAGCKGAGTGNRVNTGAGYYGMMDLEGNLAQNTVIVATDGLAFTGEHGNGALTSTGAHDVPGWPARYTWPSYGFGQRGGSWLYSGSFLGIANRISAAPNYIGASYIGGRGVRSAP